MESTFVCCPLCGGKRRLDAEFSPFMEMLCDFWDGKNYKLIVRKTNLYEEREGQDE